MSAAQIITSILNLATALLAFHWLTESRKIPWVGRIGVGLVIMSLIWRMDRPNVSPDSIALSAGLALWLASRLVNKRPHIH